MPVGFIVGAPRSGTTLLFQLAARYLELGYPTNFVARYWISPVAGQAIYQRLYSQEERDIPLRSLFGGTEGIHSPHEFSWFWQFYTDFQDVDELTNEELDAIDWAQLRRKMNGLTGFTGRPWLFKSLNYTVYNIHRFAQELPESKYIFIQREKEFTVQSILECRDKRYGDPDKWWSIRPRDVEEWLDRSGLEQVCHQVLTIHKAIERDFESLPEHRKLIVHYEDLVASPEDELSRLAEFMGVGVKGLEQLSMSELKNGNIRRLSEDQFQQIEENMTSWA